MKNIEELLIEAGTYKGFRKGRIGVVNNMEAIATSIAVVENSGLLEKLIEKEDKVVELLEVLVKNTTPKDPTLDEPVKPKPKKIVNRK